MVGIFSGEVGADIWGRGVDPPPPPDRPDLAKSRGGGVGGWFRPIILETSILRYTPKEMEL